MKKLTFQTEYQLMYRNVEHEDDNDCIRMEIDDKTTQGIKEDEVWPVQRGRTGLRSIQKLSCTTG